MTTGSNKRSASVSKVIRRIRGEGTPTDECILCENFTLYRVVKRLLDG
jgi:hypothetical protein